MTTTTHPKATSIPAGGRSTWRLVASLAGPALLVVLGLLSPINDAEQPPDRLADVFASEARYTVALLCLAAAMMLLVPAVVALRDIAPPAARRTAAAGATIAAGGFMCFLVVSGALGFAPSAWASLPEDQRSELLPAFTAMDEGEGALSVVLVGPLLPVVGLTVLAIALWRHTTLPKAALIALPAGWGVFLFAAINPIKSLGALVFLIGVAALLRQRQAREIEA